MHRRQRIEDTIVHPRKRPGQRNDDEQFIANINLTAKYFIIIYSYFARFYVLLTHCLLHLLTVFYYSMPSLTKKHPKPINYQQRSATKKTLIPSPWGSSCISFV